MAGTTTYFGISYPTSTDLVKDGAANMQTIATGFDSAVAIPTYNAQTGTTYTFALADIPKTVTASNASAQTYTIPTQATVTWPANTTLNVINLGAGTLSIAGAVGVTLTNSATTLSQYQSAALVRTGSDAWTLVPFAGGALPLNDSAISGTTGSPTTGTFTDGGINYKYYRFTGSGSITTTRAGLVDLLVVAGAGSSTGNVGFGSGAGGMVVVTNYYLTAATQTVVVGGGGGAGGFRGNQSSIANLTAVGGGPNAHNVVDLQCFGGSSGSKNAGSTSGQNVAGQGNIGFVGGTGGGGGAGGNGGSTAGGVGLANSYTGSSVTYSTGGASTGGAGSANTGNGAGGSAAANGGSGILVVRVRA